MIRRWTFPADLSRFLQPQIRRFSVHLAPTEREARTWLFQRGLGRPSRDAKAGGSWAQTITDAVQHCRLCGPCRSLVELRAWGDPIILKPGQAREDVQMKIVRQLAFDCGKMGDRIAFLGHAKHSERARVPPSFALRLMNRSVSEGSVRKFLQDLEEGRNTEEARFFREDPLSRLEEHVVLSSLFVTNKAIDHLHYDCHDYTYYKETPPRNKTIWTGTCSFGNPDGVTVLEAVSALTDWTDSSDLHEGELVRFAGLEWDPDEFRELPGNRAMDVEVVAVYADNSQDLGRNGSRCWR